ncbi:MmgE/PrpD family protein [Nocardioides sp. zg-536]|uniref:MmgE/PrpD family protein n=1 Tax=Nocardioides faecalis TaxID=2803858 RepID=A0A938YAL8_9ACTN|nr:MmgE/PrpD family protein [Nocardioides faecalis]MBM9460339.1 MmgE/PrpD family protein [Nocardioides faecalis]MBS4751264.1 MmgE/PrpD family protein [Nocardioides faecalis]QVI59833.1 MmgE/PrpD family protein [Nocardioides faecalis]
MPQPLARILAEHFAAAPAQPEPKLAEMKRLLTDFVGVGLAGSQADTGQLVGQFVTSVGGAPEASLIGSGARVPMMHAAFANAISEHSVELDDVDELALFHYAPVIMSTALAVGQATRASGAEVLSAALSGAEMMARLSRATNSALRDRGFHTTPTCGVFGATVTAGRLLGLDADQLTSALGLAGAQASGLMEMYGTSMQKRFNPGPAARNGVVAAQLAKIGFTGADTIIDGERGFAQSFAGFLDPEPLTAGLGEDVPVFVEYKPYSCARPIHNAIDCALEVRPHVQGRLDDIKRLVVKRHPDWAHYHVIGRPRTFHEAQVSLPYAVAVALIEGQALPAQFSSPILEDERVQNLSAIVEVEPDDSLARGVSCHLQLELTDGTVHESVVDSPRGSLANPLDDEALLAKSTSLGAPVVGADRFAEIARVVGSFEKVDSVDELMDLLVAEGADRG